MARNRIMKYKTRTSNTPKENSSTPCKMSYLFYQYFNRGHKLTLLSIQSEHIDSNLNNDFSRSVTWGVVFLLLCARASFKGLNDVSIKMIFNYKSAKIDYSLSTSSWYKLLNSTLTRRHMLCARCTNKQQDMFWTCKECWDIWGEFCI